LWIFIVGDVEDAYYAIPPRYGAMIDVHTHTGNVPTATAIMDVLEALTDVITVTVTVTVEIEMKGQREEEAQQDPPSLRERDRLSHRSQIGCNSHAESWVWENGG
jgi:hypothetical protein